MPANALLFQLAFSAIVIVAFGYRQFNTWTKGESCRATSDSELLAFAPPRSFTPLWRFLATAALYCLTLVVLYLVVFVMLYNGSMAGFELLEVSGVTQANAWLVALLIVTGLSPMLPVFSNVEHVVREVMHNWAVVPAKAQDMANELASPTTTFELDEALLRSTVMPRLDKPFTRGDFTEGRAVTVAQKWCRLKMLLLKFAPPDQDGLEAPRFKSPYATRFVSDCKALERDIREFAETSPELLRTLGGSPAAVLLSERLDQMQHRLFVLMCCAAFAAARSVEEVVRYFRKSYGIGIGHVQLSSAPFDPILDTLIAVTLTVLLISLGFSMTHHDSPVHVRPFLWAANAFCVHGAGLLVGWLVFSRRRDPSGAWVDPSDTPLSRSLLLACLVLAFSLAAIPTFLASVTASLLNGSTKPLLTLASDALLRTWPWAFLGSATAIATFIHLERSANGVASLRLRALSAVAQAGTNIAISLVILGVFTRPGETPPDLFANLAQPLYQLVIVLTGAIGVVLGFFLPRVVHGHGLDRRAGVARFPVDAERARATFTYCGKQVPVTVAHLSLSGAVLELAHAHVDVVPGRQGVLTLVDGAAISVHVARLLPPEEDESASVTPRRFAVRHAAMHGPVATGSGTAGKLHRFLGSLAPQPAT
ncbi:MAG: hypothetical protein JF586_16280 [Burkholderiales bacterium]|nr:hypothetical protein [Burkholderiales bacterium]